MKKFDERDTMFSRMGLTQGTKKYRDYYSGHPELKDEDDRIRSVSFERIAKKMGKAPVKFLRTMRRMQAIMNLLSRFTGKRLRDGLIEQDEKIA